MISRAKILVPTIGFLMTMVSACGWQSPEDSRLSEAWDWQNAPENWGISNNVSYLSLPQSGKLEHPPWLSTYWPTYQAGIAQRWQRGNLGIRVEDYLYTPPSRNELSSMSAGQLNLLSPIEKYDLWMGDVDFNMTYNELARVQSSMNAAGRIPTWYGLCHGWAPASFMEEEPQHSVPVTLADGREMKFYADDLKALMISAYANPDVAATFIGTRCESKNFVTGGRYRTSASCRDTNPGAFHLALTEYVGRQKKGFVVEVEKSKEIWNQPVAGYAFKYGKKRRIRPAERRRRNYAPRAVAVVTVFTRLDYSIEAEPGVAPGTSYTDSMDLQYVLELDRFDRIVGGEWKSQQHPDFLWIFEEKPENATNGLSVSLIRGLISQSRQ